MLVTGQPCLATAVLAGDDTGVNYSHKTATSCLRYPQLTSIKRSHPAWTLVRNLRYSLLSSACAHHKCPFPQLPISLWTPRKTAGSITYEWLPVYKLWLWLCYFIFTWIAHNQCLAQYISLVRLVMLLSHSNHSRVSQALFSPNEINEQTQKHQVRGCRLEHHNWSNLRCKPI